MIEEVAKNYAWGGEGRLLGRKTTKHDVDTDALASKVDLLTRKLEKANFASSSTSPQQAMACDTCGGNDHTASYCISTMEQAAMMGVRSDPYSQTDNQGWRNHQDFGWKNKKGGVQPPQNTYQQPPPYRPPGFNQGGPSQQKPPFNQPPQKSSLESVLESFMLQQTKANSENEKRQN